MTQIQKQISQGCPIKCTCIYPSVIKAFPEPSRQRSELLAGLLHPFWHPQPQCCSQQSHHDQIQSQSTRKRASCASRVLLMGYAGGTGEKQRNDDNTHRCAPALAIRSLLL